MTFRTTANKIAATGLAASIAALAATAGNANAAEPVGLGSSSVATTVLDAKVGRLLGLTLLKDSSFANTDQSAGPIGAVAKLTSLQLSSTIAALNTTLGEHRVSSPGTPSTVTASVLDLGAQGLPAGVLGGRIEPITLSALHSPTSATSSSAKLVDLNALGGIVGVGVVNSTDKTGSGTLAAVASRTLAIDNITGLKLGELLKMLGFDLLKLPIATVNGLINTLGITGLGLPANTDLQSYVGSLGTGLTQLVQSTNSDTVGPVFDALSALPGISALVPTADVARSTAIATLTNVLQTLVSKVVDALENAVLIQINALSLNADTKATNAVGSSLATASGTLGGIKVGKLDIPGVNLASTADTVNNTLAAVEGALNTVLTPLGLTNIIKLRLFERKTSVENVNGYVKAAAEIVAVDLKVTPPANLSALIANISAGVPLLGDGSGLAALPVPALGQALGGVQSVLKDGVSLEIGRVTAQSLHAVPATATPGSVTPTAIREPGTLPRTGGEELPLAFGALTLGGLALVARRLSRRSSAG